MCSKFTQFYTYKISFIVLIFIGFFFFKLNSSILYIKSDILPYDLSILLIIKLISFLSTVICLSEKIFSIIANTRSLSGLSIFANKQFFDLDFKSSSKKLISLIGLRELYQYKPKKVIIHDAVRPNITTKQISQVIENIIENYAIVPAINISDTLIHKKNNMNINNEKI